MLEPHAGPMVGPRALASHSLATHAWQDTKLDGLKAEEKALAETEKK